jgi:curli biogenesis system outer membrane secretion channel CsgG
MGKEGARMAMRTTSVIRTPVVAAVAAIALIILPTRMVSAQEQPVDGQPVVVPPEGAPPPEGLPVEPQPQAPPLPGQTRVAVVAFESPPQAEIEYQIGPGLADMLITALVNQHRFWVAERTQLEKLLMEQDLGLEGIVDISTAAEASQVVGVRYLVMGKVTNFGFRGREAGVGGLTGGLLGRIGGVKASKRKAQVAVDVRMVDAKTGRIVLSKRASGESTDGGAFALGGDPDGLVGLVSVRSEEFENSMLGRACRKAIDNLVKLVVEYFPFECRVAAVTGGHVYLDAGKFQGLKPGARLRVLREKFVTDNDGNVVFTETTELGTISIVEVANDTAKAKADPGAGDIREGDKAMEMEKKGKKKGRRR